MKRWMKSIVLASIGSLLLIGGILSWNLYFSKFKIFYDQEDLFLETVERYYSMNQQFLPKTGEVREVTLQDMYDGGHLGDLKIPKTNQLCDSEYSFVRVYKNNDNEYQYTVYLKCGKYESNVDHEGPQIALNGDSHLYLSIGTNYEELGIESVVDDVDGKMDVNSVSIDSSKVNINKVGNYEVTYTVRDKAYNKTIATRKVTVAQNLTSVVQNATDESNYYKGNNVDNNYLLFSGMLFRIIKADDDGSIMIISDESVTNLRMNQGSYEGSNADIWLHEVYYKSLHNADEYLVDATYCIGDIRSLTDYSSECDIQITSKVGLLSIGDYMKTVIDSDTYLENGSYYALSHKIGNNYVVVPVENDTMQGLRSSVLGGIRPVLHLKSNLYIMSGNGTSTNPYKLNDYSYGTKNETIDSRLIGEYLEYSGLTFRIIGVDSKKNVRLILNEPWTVQPYNDSLKLSVAELENLEFNTSDKNNPGYILNNDYIDYIDSRYIVDTNYQIPTNDASLIYNQYSTKSVKAKILLPKTYELFSTIGNNEASRATGFMYIDKSVSENMIFMANGNNGLMYEFSKDTFYSYSTKIVITIKGNLKISSGKGTVNQPYIIK